MSLKFEILADTNRSRAEKWHDGSINNWSLTDWSNAMAGEAGEACNAVKKLRRIEDGIKNISEDESRQLSSGEQAKDKIAEECADTLLYLDLLCQRIGRSLEDAVVAKFNKTSIEYGFPERLRQG